MDKGTYVDSKGKQHLISRMNFVYLQNAIKKLIDIEELQQLNDNHDLVKKRKELEIEYQSRPEYQPPNLPKFTPSTGLQAGTINSNEIMQDPNLSLKAADHLPKAKPIKREWDDVDDDF